jgi:Sugar (pentulose and hexulose) kinases
LPTALVLYPLARKGERLPFLHADAEGFVIGRVDDETALYAAGLEAVALVERWIYELLDSLGAGYPKAVFTTGGGARSRVWSQLRADVLQVEVRVPEISEAAMGSAVLAASKTLYSSLESASRAMVRIGYCVEPRPEHAEVYVQKLKALRGACAERGYLVNA